MDRHPTFHQFLEVYGPMATRLSHGRPVTAEGEGTSAEEARAQIRRLKAELAKVGRRASSS